MKALLRNTALATVLLGLGATGALSETLRIGVAAEPYPPFTVPDAKGNWSGWEIEFIDALCAEINKECVITPVPWEGVIPALTSGKIDAIITSMSITDERRKTIDFSEKYYKSPGHVVGLKELKMDATPAGLDGKILGVQVSTIFLDYAQKHFTGATLREYQTQDEVVQDLISGRIDAAMADSQALAAFLQTSGGSACCDLKGAIADDESILGYGTGVGLRKDSDDLRMQINAGIKSLRDKGIYQKFSAKYFDFDIYGE